MTLNPRDYDLDELRKMARERNSGPRGPTPAEGDEETAAPEPEPDLNGRDPAAEGEAASASGAGGRSPSRDRFESGLYRELMPLEAGTDDLTKPYLEALPESYAAEYVIFEWLEYLLDGFGYKGASEALQYYEEVGWITGEVEGTLNDYLLGLEDPAGEVTDVDVDDHKLSLVYVARLVSMT